MLVQDVSKEAVGVREALRTCTLSYTDHPVLLRMQNAALEINQSGHEMCYCPRRLQLSCVQLLSCLVQTMFQYEAFKFKVNMKMYLLAHRFRVGDGCTEEAIPLQSAIQSSPVVVAVTSVRQAPGDQSVKLPVSRVTWFP